MGYVVRYGKKIEVETLETVAPPPRRKRAPARATFAKIPHIRAIQLYGKIDGAAWIVLFELDRLIFKAFGRNPVRLTNQAFEAIGMVRSTKLKALRQLEDAGVITVVRDGFKAPLVAHLWHPLKP
jgi:hypothetical protein